MIRDITPSTEEITSTHWTTARRILGGIKAHTAFALAGQIALGFELRKLQAEHGFIHGGDRKSSRHDGDLISERSKKTWDEWLKEELGLSERTAHRFMLMADYCRPKVKKLGGETALAILEKPVGTVTEEEQAAIIALVQKCTDAETQADFLKEIGMAKNPHVIEGGHHPRDPNKPAPDQEQLLLGMWVEPISGFLLAFAEPKAEESLWRLPLREPEGDIPSLMMIEATMERELKRVREIRKKRQTGQTLEGLDILC